MAEGLGVSWCPKCGGAMSPRAETCDDCKVPETRMTRIPQKLMDAVKELVESDDEEARWAAEDKVVSIYYSWFRAKTQDERRRVIEADERTEARER